MASPAPMEILATILFGLALIHTFLANKIEHYAHQFHELSFKRRFLEYMGEVEVIFGFWAFIYVVALTCMKGFYQYGHGEGHDLVGGSVHFLESLSFVEPMFVFVIMCVSGTRPLIYFAEEIVRGVSKLLPMSGKMAFYFSLMTIGPLLGSFITEPAAMTVTALILLSVFYRDEKMSLSFKYGTLALLFVNISIGGTMTNFAAPPVLMVAAKWHWGIGHMMGHFGYKAVIAVIINSIIFTFKFRKELKGPMAKVDRSHDKMPGWIVLVHLIFVGLTVFTSHHPTFFFGLFLIFIGFAHMTQRYQDTIKYRESLLVAFFLAGLVILGDNQRWWLAPILAQLGDLALFYGATVLTAFTDNAALTYLGSLVEINDSAKYFLVAGAVAGGGLTVVANGPNPAGFGILKGAFGKDGVSMGRLSMAAIVPTVVALLAFQFLISIDL